MNIMLHGMIILCYTFKRHDYNVKGHEYNVKQHDCSARDWERSGLLEENAQSRCPDICASLKGPL